MEHIPVSSKALRHNILTIAVPISLQSLFQASLSVIDQVMVGQLGTNSIAAIGLGARFANLFLITAAAMGTSASIMISQYCGNHDAQGVNHTFVSNGFLASVITLIFLLPSLLCAQPIIGLYTTDMTVIPMAADYLRIMAIGYIPLLGTTMLSTVLRSTGYAKFPMVAGIVSVITNTLLNYILIFGMFGAPKLGLNGTAIATTVSRFVECLILLYFFHKSQQKSEFRIRLYCTMPISFLKQTVLIASPIVLNEFLWGFGETVYAAIYGHIGTEQMAAMTLTAPIQSLSIGLFTGFSTAAAILVGNHLGKDEKEPAFALSRKFIKLGIFGSVGLGILLVLLSNWYTDFFDVSPSTKQITIWILYVFAAVLFVKVSNMIMSGGILRSGGKTKYTLLLDVLGTWTIGVPLGFLAAFVWNLPIHWVYFFISVEEIVRFLLGLAIFESKRWIQNITVSA